MTTGGCASAASEIEAGSIYPTLQERRAAAAKQATCVTCYWCGVLWDAEGGGGLSVRRHSSTRRRHRVKAWRIADWLKNDKKKTVEVKQSRQLGCIWYLGFIRQKQAQCVLDKFSMYLIWPQTDQVYLFLAAAL